MRYRIVSLNQLMETLDSKSITKLLSTFRCEKNAEAEHFLKNTARLHDSRDISRTFLWMDDSDSIAGFFTLAMKCLEVCDVVDDESLSRSLNLDNGIAQAYLLGQLARSDCSEKGLGKRMMAASLSIFSDVKRSLGCRLVRLDCTDELVTYYSNAGFRKIGHNVSRNLNQMAMII